MELNVSRLAGVVVAYDRVLGEQMPDEESMSRGVNFVFGGRLEERTMENLSEMKPTKSIQESTHQRRNNRVVKWSPTPISVPGGPSPLEPGTLTRKIAQAPKGVIRLNTVTQRELACDGTCTIE